MISIVVPIYNAEKIVRRTYQILTTKLKEIGNQYELLFRNDGSKDLSYEILKDLANKDSRVKIFSHNPNKGLGYTLRELFEASKGDIVIYLDADLSFGIDVLKPFLEEIRNADVIVASRYTGLRGRIPLKREFTSRLYYIFSKLLFNISVKDIGSGFVMFKRYILDRISLSSNGFDIHIEFFAKIEKMGFSIKEIPVKYFHNSKAGTFSVLKHGPKIVLDTFRVWWKIRDAR